jgi:hypothetical protein
MKAFKPPRANVLLSSIKPHGLLNLETPGKPPGPGAGPGGGDIGIGANKPYLDRFMIGAHGCTRSMLAVIRGHLAMSATLEVQEAKPGMPRPI